MYDDAMKGHKSSVYSMNNATVKELGDIWPIYFPEEAGISVTDPKYHFAADMVEAFSTVARDFISPVENDGDGIFVLHIDFHRLQKSCEVIKTKLEESPKEALLRMGAAAHLVMCREKSVDIMSDEDEVQKFKVNIRLYNYTEKINSLKDLKAAYIKKIVTVCGTVVKVSTVKPLVMKMNFRCMKCASEKGITRVFCDGKFSPPASCNIQGCKSRTFTPDRSTAQLIDFQKIRIQELVSADNHEEGRVPRTVECELTEDLVDCCIPGEIVTVTGIVKVLNNYMDIGGGKSKNKNQGLYYLYLEAISVRNMRTQAVPDEEIQASGHIHFRMSTRSDLNFVVNYKEEHGSDVFRQILQSFCPSIYGHELVKAGITLALFGGVQKNSMDQNKVPVRGDVHVIIVGDPGLGKSQLLQAAAAVSPRGIYVCGNTTTKAGLTVAVVKDSMTNDYAFEAGAMVLADSGLCCIDEFDKMSGEHQALLEAMEQQCVSVAKAGLVASLSARTSVLAAANPVGGHYELAKTVNENLKMSAALLSRFDLVFILLDSPNELLDKRVSDHIISLHSNNGRHLKKIRKVSQCHGDLGSLAGGNSLISRLRLHPEKDKGFAPLPGQLIRKYITYAREHVFPSMSQPAADILRDFYLELRKCSTSDGTPITARQLESLVRLAEARARVDLREEVTAEDAEDVVQIMKESLHDKYVDERGVVDFARSGGMSQHREAKRLIHELNKQSELQQKDLFSKREICMLADKISLKVPDLDAVVDSLNNENFLLKKGPGMYQLLTASYS